MGSTVCLTQGALADSRPWALRNNPYGVKTRNWPMLSVPCPNCRKLLQVVETSTDRQSQCPACGVVFTPKGPSPNKAADSPTVLPPRTDREIFADQKPSVWSPWLPAVRQAHAAHWRQRVLTYFAAVAIVTGFVFVCRAALHAVFGEEGWYNQLYGAAWWFLLGAIAIAVREAPRVLRRLRDAYLKNVTQSAAPSPPNRQDEE